jgi:hypothetical protein
VHFIRKHYLKNKDNIFSPQSQNIVPYFKGHNQECFFSFYQEDNLLLNEKRETVEEKRMISLITSRPIHIRIHNGTEDNSFYAYYVDFLCVDKGKRKQGIAPEIIQTHEYNQRHLNKNIQVSLFKREGELTGIVPLCVYDTIGYEMADMDMPENLEDPTLKIIEIGVSNIQHLYDFIQTKKKQFSLVASVDMGNLLELIKSGNLFVMCLLKTDINEIEAAYFFRRSCTFVRKDVQTLHCLGSIYNHEAEAFN